MPSKECWICRHGEPALGRPPMLEAVGWYCVECRLKHMDPFNPYYPGGAYFAKVCNGSLNLNFNIPKYQEDRRSGLELIARMVVIDHGVKGKHWYKHSWPQTLVLRINGTVAAKVKPPEPGHKRRDEPIAVTPFFRTGSNTVELLSDRTPSSVAFGILLCKPRQPDELVAPVLKAQTVKYTEGHARLLHLLRPKKDSECSVVDDSRELRLLCPISFERVETPARGRRCDHIRCFDLSSYIQAMRRMKAFNNRWCCPICQESCRLEDLVVDEMMINILNSTAAEEIVFNPDGTWALLNGKTVIAEPPRLPADKCVDLDSPTHGRANGAGSPRFVELSDTPGGTPTPQKAAPKSAAPKQGVKRPIAALTVNASDPVDLCDSD